MSPRVSTPWRKALRDFWGERTRTLLVVLAIALGISGFSVVLSTYAILTRELNEGYLATHPASATLWTNALEDDLPEKLRALGGLEAVEARRVLRGRIKAGPIEWRGLQLFVVGDYGRIQVGTLKPEAGAWPPAKGEMLIERDAFQVVKARIGDTVTVRLSGATERTLRVAGRVHDVGQAQARMENSVYGYVTLDTLAELGEEPYLDQLQIRVAGNSSDEAHVREVAEETRRRVESLGHPVHRMDVPKPGEHPHAAIMGLLLLAQAGFGLFGLVLSGVLVVNLLTALVASQVRQIGVMKAIGGSRFQITSIYLGQALFLGVAALVLAIPVGVVGSRALSRYMGGFLNFDITSFAVPLWVYLLEAAVGLLAPLLAAAYPVAKGSAVSVREALSDFGVTETHFGASAFDRAIASLGGASRPLLLAVRNSFRRRARLLLTLSTLAIGGVFFMSALNVRSSMVRTLDRLFDSKRYDLTLSLAAPYPAERLERAIGPTAGVSTFEGWITAEAEVVRGRSGSPFLIDKGGPPGGSGGSGADLHGAGVSNDRFPVIAVPTPTQRLALEIVEGRDLRPGDVDAIVVNGALAAKGSGMKVGNEVLLRMGQSEATWRVVGLAREAFSPPTGYVPRAFFDQRGGPADASNSVRLVLDRKDPASIAAVRAALDRSLEREGVRTLGSSTKNDGRYAFDQHMLMIYVFLNVVSGILVGVGGLGLVTTMSLNILERRREMGVMRAIGATPAVVCSIVAAEGLAIGLMSWAASGLVAWPVSRLMGNLLAKGLFTSGLDFAFETRGLWIWLAVCGVLGVAASVLPAWRASRRPVREAIGYE